MALIWRICLLLIIACNLIPERDKFAVGANENQNQNEDSTRDETQPGMPHPFLSYGGGGKLSRPVVKLVAEVSSPLSGGPVLSQEEYLDLVHGSGRYALVRGNTREVLLSRGPQERIITYRPYTCTVHTDEQGLIFQKELDDLSKVTGDGLSVRVFGLLGLWMAATLEPHSYKFVKGKANTNYDSPGRHVFTVRRGDKLDVRLHFTEPGMQPDVVEVLDLSHGSVLRRFTVLSFETGLDEIQEDVLEVPVGFDCARALIEANSKGSAGEQQQNINPAGDVGGGDGFLNNYMFQNSYAKFEVTATKLEQAGQQTQAIFAENNKRSSWMETIYVEISHSEISARHRREHFGLLMTKIKSKQQETRTVLNHFLNVQYEIDSRQGTCKVSHLRHEMPGEYTASGQQQQQQEAEDELEDGRLLKFSNGLELPFHRRQLAALFANPGKTSQMGIRQERRNSFDKTKMIEYNIFEQAQFEWPYDKQAGRRRFARIIRTYARTLTLMGNVVDTKLESVTLLLVSPEQDWIMESYHFNLIKAGQFLSWLEIAAAFDISEDCYLSDPRKRAGQDYAWVELYYPISSRQMNSLLQNEAATKEMLYLNYMSSTMWSPFSMPRCEMMFTDEALVVRLLLLELPALELVFDSGQGLSIGSDGINAVGEGLIWHNSPDLRHCSRLCQLNDCYSMSFCESSRHCLLSGKPVKLTGMGPDGPSGNTTNRNEAAAGQLNKEQFSYEQVVNRMGCVTYSHPHPKRVRELRQQRLVYVLSRLRNQDFDLDAPKLPDELALPRSETGISQQEWNQAVSEFAQQVAKFNQAHTNRVPELTWWIMLEGQPILIMPTMCHVIEENPLEELILRNPSGSTQEAGDGGGGGGMLEQVHGDDVRLHDLDQVVQFFDIVLNDRCLDIDLYAQSNSAARSETTAAQLVPRLHYLSGLTYDQCALACLDAQHCGLFSYWATTSSCIISNLAQARQADELKFLVARPGCFVAQRDYAQHFHKFENVAPSLVNSESHKSVVATPNDCALTCITAKDFNCFSFDFCAQPNGDGHEANCHLLEERRTAGLNRQSPPPPSSAPKKGGAANKTTENGLFCDHYERDYLAEFTEIPFHGFKAAGIEKFAELSELEDKSSFECADACLNQNVDCSAFEFCAQASAQTGGRYRQSCRLVRMSGGGQRARGAEFEVPDDDPERVKLLENGEGLAESDWLLVHSEQCHVYALKPNTIQAHLRSLALGQTMTRHEHEQLEHRLASLSLGFTWAGLFLFLLTLATISTALGFGLYWSRERSDRIRHHSDRIESYLRALAGRLTGR